MDWTPANRSDVVAALERIPAGSFLLTSAHTDQRGGVAVKWVQQCCESPPMVMVAVEKGHSLSPVIRDSRSFAVCQLDPTDRGTLRSFDQQQPGIDPFVGMLSTTSPSGAPVPARALAFIDCELARHVDIDGDHEIYVGVVHHASALRDPLDPSRCLCDETTAQRPRAGRASNGVAHSRNGTSTRNGTSNGSAARHGASQSNGRAIAAAAVARLGAAAASVRSAAGRLGGAREAAAKLERARKRR